MNKKIFKLKIQLSAAIFILLVLVASGFFIFGPDLGKVALALTNYSKSAGDQLRAVQDWNNLVVDFLARDGTGNMDANLNMGNNRITNLAAPTADNDAVNRGAMNTAIAAIPSNIRNATGGNLRMICGKTNPSDWTYPFDEHKIVRVEIDTSAVGFNTANPVQFFTTIQGRTQHFYTKGATSIYPRMSGTTELPTHRGFVVFVMYEWTEPNFLSSRRAEEWGWYINWCGMQLQ